VLSLSGLFDKGTIDSHNEYTNVYHPFHWSSEKCNVKYWVVGFPMTPVDGPIQQGLGCNGCDVTSVLPDDVTMMTVALAMGHGQTSLLKYVMTSQNKTMHTGYLLMSL